MSKHPSALRKTLFAALAISSMALSACIVEPVPRPGVDYGYVAGTGSATPYATAPYGDPYDSPYYDDSYYGYNGAYYGSPYYGGGYYGPSATFIYSPDRYYPAYGYPSRGNSYRHDYDRNRHDDDRGDYRGGHSGHGGYDGGGDRGHDGSWNHDRPGRPDTRVDDGPQHDHHPRPVMGGGHSGLGDAPDRGNRAPPSAPPPRATKPDRESGGFVRQLQRNRDDRKQD